MMDKTTQEQFFYCVYGVTLGDVTREVCPIIKKYLQKHVIENIKT